MRPPAVAHPRGDSEVKGTFKDGTEIGEFAILFTTLHADINEIYPYTASDAFEKVSYPDPVYLSASDRRNLVRSVFAFIEGNAYFLRQMLLKSFQDVLSPEIQLALAEQQIEISGNGTVKKKAMRAGALNMLKLTFSSFETVLPNLSGVKCAGPDFESLVRSINVRDRLMHPKSARSLTVSDEEIRDIAQAFVWFGLMLMNIIKAANAALKEKVLRDYGVELKIKHDPPGFEVIKK